MTATLTAPNWGVELWDQYDNISLHTLKGIDFLERFGHFFKDRATIENEYASKLRRLVKNYQPKKKDEEEEQFSSCKAFRVVMDEVIDLAGQHEIVAEHLQANVIKELTALVKDMRDERKKQLLEGQRLSQTLNTQIDTLQRSKKAYDKAFRDSEKATDAFQKADADLNLSRAEVEKQRTNLTYKIQVCDTAKNEYAVQLQKTNELQRQHFRSSLPEIFRQLQELDEKRIRNIRNFIRHSVDIERNVFPIINKCMDGILKAADIINETDDTLLVIEGFKSGFLPPEDFPFEDLSKGGGGSNSGSANNISSSSQFSGKLKDSGLTVRGTLSGKSIKKRAGIFNMFSSRANATIHDGKEDDLSDLPPNQRRKKLLQKVDDLKIKVDKEIAIRDGITKMKGVYEASSTMGDPKSVEGQLNECCHRLDKLQDELKRTEGYLEKTKMYIPSSGFVPSNSLTNSPSLVNGSSSASTRNHRNSGGDEESLSRSASDISVSNPTQNHNKQSAHGMSQLNNNNDGCSNSPESGLGASHTSLPGADSDPDQYDGHAPDPESEYYEADLAAAIGTCKAMYSFETTSEGSIPMDQDEMLHLIEVDQGDGWTRVRRMNANFEEGFVPSSYIKCTMFHV